MNHHYSAAADPMIEHVSSKIPHLHHAVMAMMTGDSQHVAMANAAYTTHKSGVAASVTRTSDGATQTNYSAKPVNVGGPILTA